MGARGGSLLRRGGQHTGCRRVQAIRMSDGFWELAEQPTFSEVVDQIYYNVSRMSGSNTVLVLSFDSTS